MNIREARMEDAPRLSEIAKSAVEPLKKIDFDVAGWGRFVEATAAASIERRIGSGSYICVCALQNEVIVGFITIKDFAKIDQLFVEPKSQKLGVARNLWEYARQECLAHTSPNTIWVRSSSYAIPVYQRFGFEEVGAPQDEDGAFYQLMRIELIRES